MEECERSITSWGFTRAVVTSSLLRKYDTQECKAFAVCVDVCCLAQKDTGCHLKDTMPPLHSNLLHRHRYYKFNLDLHLLRHKNK